MFLLAVDPVPDDNSVVAGPIGFVVFILLIAAVALLCWSFVRQLRKVEKAKEAGVYGEVESADDAELSEDAAETHDADA